MMEKLTSRKFWIATAAFLASIASSISGIATDNTVIAGIGIGCAVASAAIYSAAEAYVDAANVKSTTVAVQATTSDKKIIEKAVSGSAAAGDENAQVTQQ